MITATGSSKLCDEILTEWHEYAAHVAASKNVGSSIRELARRHNVLLDVLRGLKESLKESLGE